MSAPQNWGTPAPDYFGKYDVVTAATFPIRPEFQHFLIREAGTQRIQEIAQLLGDKAGSELDAEHIASQVPLSTLLSILELVRIPENYRLFLSTRLLTCCIRLLSTIKKSGKISPFSYEYGFLCFRIILLVFSVEYLHRSNQFEATLDDMAQNMDLLAMQVVGENFSRVVIEQFKNTTDPGYFDYILGWAPWKGRPCQKPIITLYEASFLFDLIYENRKEILEMSTVSYLPSTASVYFLLWRYWRMERVPDAGLDPDSLSNVTSMMIDPVWRCTVVAPTEQAEVLILIHNDIGQMIEYARPCFVDSWDSYNIVEAVITRLPRWDVFLCSPVDPTLIPVLVMFAGSYLRHDAIDMLPTLILKTMRQEWVLLLNPKTFKSGSPLLNLRRTLRALTNIYESIDPMPEELALEAIDAVVKADVLGLMARMMVDIWTVHRGAPAQTCEHANQDIFQAFEEFFEAICETPPMSSIDSKCRSTFHDWFKYLMYFTRRERAHESDEETAYWEARLSTMYNILHTIGQAGYLLDFHNARHLCAYERCPDPDPAMGALIRCRGPDCVRWYCSLLCQRGDGKLGHSLECTTSRD